MFGIEYVIFVIIVQMLIGTCQGRFGSNAVAIPALNEVTSDQGLAVLQSFLTQSFDQSTQYRTTQRISAAVLLLSALSQS
jgi:aminoglycoside/choline kinase family phosphotransferase